MRYHIVGLFAAASSLVACYSTSGGDHGGSAGFSSGASAGSGAVSSGGSSSGGSHSGGSSSGGSSSGGLGGSGGEFCGACPGIACLQGFWLEVLPDPAVAPANLTDLQVDVAGLTVTCTPGGSDCSMYCMSEEYMIPDGHYTVTISATGFVTQTISFDAVAPTNCGCCGCCPYSFNQVVTLTSDGTAVQDTCCGSGCAAELGACLVDSSGYTSCNDYCTASGQVCAAACGTPAVASKEYYDTLDCSDTATTIFDSTDCSAPFVIGNALRSYRCCCASP